MGFKFSTNVVLFLVAMNVLVGGAEAAGMWEDWGIPSPAPGVSEEISQAQDAYTQLSTGGLGAQTLVTLFLFGLQVVQVAWQLVTVAPAAFSNIGVPGFIATLGNGIMFFIVGIEALEIYLGRRQ